MSDIPALVALLDDWYQSGEDGDHDNLYLAARALERLEKALVEARNFNTAYANERIGLEMDLEAAEKRCKALEKLAQSRWDRMAHAECAIMDHFKGDDTGMEAIRKFLAALAEGEQR